MAKVIGYDTKYALINAADYGLPQRRNRVYFVGIRQDLNENYEYEFPQPTHVGKWQSLEQYLDPVIEVNASYYLTTGMLQRVKGIRHQSARNPGEYDTNGSIKILDHSMPSNTIFKSYLKNFDSGVVQDEKGIRSLTLKEIKKLQSFPLNYKFSCEKKSPIIKLVAEAVPPLLANILGESLTEFLDLIPEEELYPEYEKPEDILYDYNDELENFTIPKLKNYCEDNKITNYSKKNKQEIMDLIRQHHNNPTFKRKTVINNNNSNFINV